MKIEKNVIIRKKYRKVQKLTKKHVPRKKEISHPNRYVQQVYIKGKKKKKKASIRDKGTKKWS